MPTVNEKLRDLEVGHAVNLQHLASGTLSKLSTILNRADAEIVAKLIARGDVAKGSYTSKRLEALLNSLRTINRNAHEEFARKAAAELKQVAAYEAGFQKKAILKALPVKMDVVTPSRQLLNAVVTDLPFQGRLLKEWVDDLSDSKARRLRDAIRLGVVQGETIDQIVKRVRGTKALNYKDGIMEAGRRGTEALVRTAVAHTTSAARDALYKENLDIIAEEQWVATLDTRTCAVCGGLDGKKFPVGEGVKTPAHIGCRCVRVPVTKSWKELGFNVDELEPGTRASMNGQVSATETYSSWLKKQSAEVQDDALGPVRADLFRKGEVTIDGFTNSGRTLTLEELSKKEGVVLAAPEPAPAPAPAPAPVITEVPRVVDPGAIDIDPATFTDSDFGDAHYSVLKSHTSLPEYVKQFSNNALEDYVGYGYKEINKVLSIPGYKASKPELVKEQIRELKALAKPTKVDYITYRGLAFNEAKALQIGDVFDSPSFTSVSRDPTVSVTFARKTGGGEKGVLFKFVTPAGTRAIVTNAGEAEIILMPGRKFRVKEVLPLPETVLSYGKMKFMYVMELL